MKLNFAATKQNVIKVTGEDSNSLTLVSTNGAAAHTVPPRTHTALQLLDSDYPESTDSAPPHTALTPQLPACNYPPFSDSSLNPTATISNLPNCNNRGCRRCARFWDQSLDQLVSHLRAPDSNHPRSRTIAPVSDNAVRFLRACTSILIDNQEAGPSSDSRSSVRLPQYINDQALRRDEQALVRDEQALGRDEQALGRDEQALGRDEQALGRDEQALGRDEQALDLERQTRIRQKDKKIHFSMAQLFVGARSRGRYIYRPTRERPPSDSEDYERRRRSKEDKHEQLARVVNGVAWLMVVLYLFSWGIRATQW